MTGTIRYHKALDKDGNWVERPEYTINGKVVSEAEYLRQFPDKDGMPYGPPLKGWPFNCEALAVHPDQRQEHEDLCKARGVPTETTPDGRIVMRNNGHMRRYLRAFGYHHRNSCNAH